MMSHDDESENSLLGIHARQRTTHQFFHHHFSPKLAHPAVGFEREAA